MGEETLTENCMVQSVCHITSLLVLEQVSDGRLQRILVGQEGHHVLQQGLIELSRILEERTERGLEKFQGLVGVPPADQLHKLLAITHKKQLGRSLGLAVKESREGLPDFVHGG